jgi:hypothetical protein
MSENNKSRTEQQMKIVCADSKDRRCINFDGIEKHCTDMIKTRCLSLYIMSHKRAQEQG